MKSDNGNVHRAAANIIVSKSRAARGSVCNVLLSRRIRFASFGFSENTRISVPFLSMWNESRFFATWRTYAERQRLPATSDVIAIFVKVGSV